MRVRVSKFEYSFTIHSTFKDVFSNRGHRPNIDINTHNTNYTYIVV